MDAQGSAALISLVGTIGSGLTWSGGIFINPIIARTDNVKLVSVLGVLVMSLGLVLASFCTKVCPCTYLLYPSATYYNDTIAMAIIPNPVPHVRARLFRILLPHYDHRTDILR